MNCVSTLISNILSLTQPSCARISTAPAQKGAAADEAIGRSRSGLSTKINAVVDAAGNLLRIIIKPGQSHESKEAAALIEGLETNQVLADRGYDSNAFRQVIADAGGEAVIPSIPARKVAIAHDKQAYKDRNVVERFFCKIKHYRRIATRYDKTVTSYAAMFHIGGAMIWLR